MQLKRRQLSEGVYFNLIPTEKFKAGFLQVRFILPQSKQTAAKNALVFKTALRGTEKYPTTTAMLKRYDELYATSVNSNVWKYGDMQIVALQSSPLDQKYVIDDTDITAGVIDLFEQVILHPLTEDGAFKAEYVESEKKRQIEQVRSEINNKGKYADTRCTEIMFEGDPYGVSAAGSIDDIEAICSKCLYEQYKTLISSARVEIFAVGNFDEEKTADGFARIFEKIERKNICSPTITPLSGDTKEVKTVYEHQSVTQGKLVLGYRTGCDSKQPDYYVMEVFNEIFGGSACSKLFMNVREKLSLCYYCSSGLIGEKGAMLIRSGIEFANEKKAVDEINVQLQKMKDGEISDGEIEDAKKGQIDGLMRVEDRLSGMVGWYFGAIMRGEEPISPEKRIEQIKSVTKEQIVEKAKGVVLDTYYFLCGEESGK